MLQGVVYDLKQTKDRKETGNLSNYSSWESRVLKSKYVQIVKSFVNGSWKQTVDSKGNVCYPDLDDFYCSPTRLWNSCFYIEPINNTSVPGLLHCENTISPGGWVSIYSGYVVAPFTGKFRFVGIADDAIVVRFNKQIVLDYGWFSCTMGVTFDSFGQYKDILGGKMDATAAQTELIKASPFFSKNKLELWPIVWEGSQERGLQRGSIISVRKGQIIPIEILISEVGVGDFVTALFVEQLDANGKPLTPNPQKLPIFRTTASLPEHPAKNYPDFEEDGPVWKVVDSFGKAIPASKFAGQPLVTGLNQNIPEQKKTPAGETKTTEQNVPVRQEDKLPGVIYDLSQTAGRKPTDLLERQDAPDAAECDFKAVLFLKKFVLGDWARRTDAKDNIIYPELSQLYRSTVTPYRSYFYQPNVTAATLRRSYTENTLSNQGWFVIHSGYVIAPFTGKFRFVGCGDDALVVRFNRQIVLDYGWYPLTLGKNISGPDDYRSFIAQRNRGRLLPEKDLYSGNIEVYFPTCFEKRGVAKGPAINVVKGQFYPIDILYSDIGEGNSCLAIFIEQLDSLGRPVNAEPTRLPLFRTTSELPGHTTGGIIPDFDENSPIWRVVGANGKPIPSRNPVATEIKEDTSSAEKNLSETKSNTSSGAAAGTTKTDSGKGQTSTAKRTVTTTKQGNVTTETITEQDGDTVIVTVTKTEMNGDTVVQTTTKTETKKGVVVKKTTSTTTTTTSSGKTESSRDSAKKETASSTPAQSSSPSSSASTSPSSSSMKTDSNQQTGKTIRNPFGYTRPLPEDD